MAMGTGVGRGVGLGAGVEVGTTIASRGVGSKDAVGIGVGDGVVQAASTHTRPSARAIHRHWRRADNIGCPLAVKARSRLPQVQLVAGMKTARGHEVWLLA